MSKSPKITSGMISLVTIFFSFPLEGNLSASPFELELQDVNQETVRLNDYAGQVLLLHFWSLSSPSHKLDLTLLQNLKADYQTNGAKFFALSRDAEKEWKKIIKLAQKQKISFPVLLGAAPEQQKEFRLADFVPATAILDRDGTIAFRIIGQLNQAEVRAGLDWLLSDRSAPSPPDLVLPAGLTSEHFQSHVLGLEDEHEHEQERVLASSEVPS